MIETKEVKLLFAACPPNFEEIAQNSGLFYMEEYTQAITRFVVNFEDIPKDVDNDFLNELRLIRDENPEHFQIIFEVC